MLLRTAFIISGRSEISLLPLQRAADLGLSANSLPIDATADCCCQDWLQVCRQHDWMPYLDNLAVRCGCPNVQETWDTSFKGRLSSKGNSPIVATLNRGSGLSQWVRHCRRPLRLSPGSTLLDAPSWERIPIGQGFCALSVVLAEQNPQLSRL